MGLVSLPTADEQRVEMMTALYGDGAWEIIKSAGLGSPPKDPRKRKAAYNAAMGGNALAIAGGVHALQVTAKETAGKLPKPTGKLGTATSAVGRALKPVADVAPKLKKVATKVPGAAKLGSTMAKHPVATAAAIGTGWMGLHSAELAADFAGRHAIKQQYKQSVHKGLIPLTKKQAEGKEKVGRIASAAGKAAVQQTKQEFGKALDFTIKGEISKSNDKRQVFGWASVVEIDGQPVVDLQSDYMAIETVEKAAYDYVHSSRRGGDQHQPGSHVSDLIESFVITPEKKQLLNLPDDTPTGWWVGFHVNDDDMWQRVKNGERPEFSIHGSGTRVDVEI